jgi:hypothetical protein
MKLTKTETAAFAEIGEALCASKEIAASKKSKMPLVAAALEENHEEFFNGVTIGDFKFKLVVREELTAIRV